MKNWNRLLAVVLVFILVFGLTLSVLAVIADPPVNPPDDEVIIPDPDPDPEPPAKEKGNNGIGNGLDPQPPGDPQENDTDDSNLPPGQLKKIK
ncbi:MAG: Uncharacterized protein CI947_1559 [Halanaerobium sp.]|nr:MAG: Uncharacterized protein CI947_1559 [Halanaerobium sp.]